MSDSAINAITGTVVFLVIVGVGLLLLWAAPNYKVYRLTLNGKAQLLEAEYTRQIAELDAGAEVARARGVAAADSIISDGLKGEVEYLQYLYIQAIKGGKCDVVYMPNDGTVPLFRPIESGSTN